MRVTNLIIKPLLTEKGMALEHEGKYIFKVNMKASKGAIAYEIKSIYGVDAIDLNTMVMASKKRRIIGTKRFTKTRKWKKVIIKLKEGQKIDLVNK